VHAHSITSGLTMWAQRALHHSRSPSPAAACAPALPAACATPRVSRARTCWVHVLERCHL
jgi:hypothetical protein